MSVASITFEIGGEAITIADASWFLVAPCGCTCGVTVAESVYGSRVVLNPDDAWSEFYPDSKEQMKRDRSAGFRVEVGHRSEVGITRLIKCPHVPEWGVTPAPRPSGYIWAGVSSSKRSHLVPWAAPVESDARYLISDHLHRAEPLLSLCGKSSVYWSTHWASNVNSPTCRTCERMARKVES